MNMNRYGLKEFLEEKAQDGALSALLLTIADIVQQLSAQIAQGALIGLTSKLGSQNVQGETQMQLDVTSNALFIERLRGSNLVHGLASEEMEEPVLFADRPGEQPFLVVFDPLDGSSNVPVNVSIGSIFSVLPAPEDHLADSADFLQPGNRQVAAGYALYGPATMLVLTFGNGTHGFTLDPQSREFVLTHPGMNIAADTSEYAINASNERFWEPPVRRYIDECRAGSSDVRSRDFNMRWVASMVADLHRILVRGGIYLYPRDHKDPTKSGRLRLMYEANPMAMLVEQAGGLASTGRQRILEIQPAYVHQRVPVIMGARHEVERLERYHTDYDSGRDEGGKLPFFNDRSFYM
ncbi:MAG TPA: class 1 fructose-bisphosphatase [Methylophilaceae bacterium]|jgi:fructose-1,6-bisphosphatase I/sedoheptulose-1,7-bisphosphatase